MDDYISGDDIEYIDEPAEIQDTNDFSSLSPELRQQLEKEIQSIIKEAHSLSQNLYAQAKGLREIIKNQDHDFTLEVDLTCEIPNPSPSPICSTTVGYNAQSNKIFKCYDCMEAENAIQCIECFSKADHKGHNFIEAFSGQGCCDCGNEQMFNPKGFCPDHSKKIQIIVIPIDVRKKFLMEGTFYLYLGFWLLDRKDTFLLNASLVNNQVNVIVQQLYTVASGDYQQKLLVYELLKQKISEVYPNLPKIKMNDVPILEMFMNWEKNFTAMEMFCRIAFEIFPVEQSRIQIIKSFFAKTKTDPNFGFHHPVRYLNFQFMTCIKTINSLIRNGELQPLEQPPLQIIKASDAGDHLFLKFVDDMHYPSSMKGAAEYHHYLVEKCNIATILSLYRELPNSKLHKNVLDDYYLKTFRQVLYNIRNTSSLLIKFIRELWSYIIQIKQPNLSLIHQRMFAFAISTYLKGQLSKLDQTKHLQELLQILNLGEDSLEFLSGRAIYHLQNFISCFSEPFLQIHKDYIREYFCAHNPQVALAFKLDYSYQKILMLLSRKRIDYPSIIIQITKNIDEKDRSFKFYFLVSFFNGLTVVEADEIQIESQIQTHNKDRLESFYSKLLNTFKHLKAVEVKRKCSAIIWNPKEFEMFFINSCNTEKGSIVTKIPSQTLEYLSYEVYLKTLYIDIFGLPEKKYSLTQLPYMQGARLWDDQSVELLIGICKSAFKEKQGGVKDYNEHKFLPSMLGFQAIKAYILSKNELLKNFLKQELGELCSTARCETLSNALRTTLNITSESELPSSKEQMNINKRLQLQQKKKEKHEKLNQNREAVLSKHGQEEVKIEGDLCIFCKEQTNQELSLLSSVSIDNLVTKAILKTESFRLCFRTCSHKIHAKCFFQQQGLLEKQCFLCRRPTNLLLPHFSQNSKPQFIDSFLNILFTTLLECNGAGEQQKAISQFSKYYCENNMARAVFSSIICEILLFEDSQDGHAKRYVAPIMKQLIHFLRAIPRETLHHAFQVDQKVMKASGQNAELYFRASQILQRYFSGGQTPEYSSIFDRKVCQILAYFDGSQTIDSSDPGLTLIKAEKYLFDLPSSLNVLQHFMGECPSCHKVTESLCLCLVCGYRVCTKEKPKLIEHFNEHLGGCVFIKCDNGMPLYLLQGEHLFLRQSIYLNYLGQPFENEGIVRKISSQYSLDKRRAGFIFQKIVRGEVKSLVMQQLS